MGGMMGKGKGGMMGMMGGSSSKGMMGGMMGKGKGGMMMGGSSSKYGGYYE